MKYPWLDAYCLNKIGAEKDFKVEWNAIRYMIRGKLFAMQGHDKEGKDIISLKLPPDQGRLLRENYKDIIPGYYMNKEHWNSVYLDGAVEDDVLQSMIDTSHRLILESLPKKVQSEIMLRSAEQACNTELNSEQHPL